MEVANSLNFFKSLINSEGAFLAAVRLKILLNPLRDISRIQTPVNVWLKMGTVLILIFFSGVKRVFAWCKNVLKIRSGFISQNERKLPAIFRT